MDVQITITVAELGRDEENGPRLLEGLLNTHPDTGPVASQDLRAGTLSATFAFAAHGLGADEIGERAVEIFKDGFLASGLPVDGLRVVEVSRALDLAERLERELQPA